MSTIRIVIDNFVVMQLLCECPQVCLELGAVHCCLLVYYL